MKPQVCGSRAVLISRFPCDWRCLESSLIQLTSKSTRKEGGATRMLLQLLAEDDSIGLERVCACSGETSGGFRSHRRMSSGPDGPRAKIAEPLDTVRLQLGQIMYINARRLSSATCWQDPSPQPRTAQLWARLGLSYEVRRADCDPCSWTLSFSQREKDPGARGSSTSTPNTHLVGPVTRRGTFSFDFEPSLIVQRNGEQTQK